MNDMDMDLRRLGRAELIEIIYEMKKNELRLTEELSAAQARLDAREYAISEAGSIADAAMRLNGVFEAAQAAADEYLRAVCRREEDARKACEAMLARTEEACRLREAEADRAIDEKWARFRAHVKEYTGTDKALMDYLRAHRAAAEEDAV